MDPLEARPPGGELTPAATVVPLRDGPYGLEVLMLRRASRGAFGGAWVFPGGGIDDGDLGEAAAKRFSRLRQVLDPDDPALTGAARRAAVREAEEEAALILDPTSLVLHSFWLPPAGTQRRFATWFFLAGAAGAGEIVVDRIEIVDHRWMTPAGAMAARDAGEIHLVPPTFMTLWWLGRQPSTAAALAASAASRFERFSTRIVADGTGAMAAAVWEGDAAFDDGELHKAGRRRRLVNVEGRWRAEVDG